MSDGNDRRITHEEIEDCRERVDLEIPEVEAAEPPGLKHQFIDGDDRKNSSGFEEPDKDVAPRGDDVPKCLRKHDVQVNLCTGQVQDVTGFPLAFIDAEDTPSKNLRKVG